jgi:hypothetical protein
MAKRFCLALTLALAAALAAAAAPAWPQDFPAAPASIAAAEAGGLRRVGVDDLKAAFAGQREERSARGESYVADYQADGRIELRAGSALVDRGTYSISGRQGGSLCLMLDKQMNQRLCTIWVAAPDSLHLYGYNPGDGTLRTLSRALPR